MKSNSTQYRKTLGENWAAMFTLCVIRVISEYFILAKEVEPGQGITAFMIILSKRKNLHEMVPN